MIGLDTNVLVRYIVQDDPRQSPSANRLVESLSAGSPGFVTVVSVVELCWVLTSAYGLDRQQWCAALEGLLRTKELVVERADLVWKALRLFQGSTADFVDCLIERSASAAGCAKTMTFDRAAAASGRMTLVA